MNPSLSTLQMSPVCSLRVLIVSEHHVRASHEQLSSHILRVGRVDHYLHVVGRTSAGAWTVFLVPCIRDQRRAFRHSVAHGVREIDAAQEFLHVGVERRTAHDDFKQLSAERLVEFGFDFAEQTVVDKGHSHQQLHHRLVEQREHFCLDDFLQHQRHCDNQSRMRLGESVHNDFRRRHTREEMQMASFRQRVQHLDREAEHVCQREHADCVMSRAEPRQFG